MTDREQIPQLAAWCAEQGRTVTDQIRAAAVAYRRDDMSDEPGVDAGDRFAAHAVDVIRSLCSDLSDGDAVRVLAAFAAALSGVPSWVRAHPDMVEALIALTIAQYGEPDT